MTFPQLDLLFEYWKRYPPVHELVMGALGVKPPKTMEQELADGAMGPEEFARWVKATGGKEL